MALDVPGANVSHSGSTNTVVFSGSGFSANKSHPLSIASSLFVTDPSRSLDFPSGIPDDLEFDNSSSSENHNASLLSPSPLHGKPPTPPKITPSAYKHSKPHYSPFESPPRSTESISSGDEGTDFQDSSFINSTRAQFDLDISIDEKKVVNGEHKLSPWRKFSTNPVQAGSLRHSSLLSKRIVTQNSIAETSSSKKLEDLSKQLTNCKIQLKLYEKFLQDLIDRHQIDVGELYEFHDNLNGKSISKLEQEHADMCTLVEDLYASLEEFQGKWRDADKRVIDLDHNIHELAFEVSDLLGSLGRTLDLDPGQNPKEYLESALPALREQIDTISKDTNKQHEQLVLDIKHEYDTYKSENFNAEKMLREQLHEINKWKNDYANLKHRFDTLQEQSATSEFERLRSENDRLSSLNKNVDDKLHEYQVMINQLQREVNEFKDVSRKGSLSDVSEPSVSGGLRDREKYLLLQRDFDNLQRMYDNMASDFDRFKETSSSTISSLTNQLNNRKRDLINLRAEHTGLDNIQHDYESAIEKQRLLTSEKMKLAWQVDSLTKDKTSLQSALERMTEKATKAGSSENEKKYKQQLEEVQQQFYSLLKLDVWEFQRLFESFNKIADDSSLEGPKKRIAILANLVTEEQTLQGKESTFKASHKSVFDYFARAVETIVNDHIRLLLKESESENQVSDAVVGKLEKKVASLEKQLDLGLMKQVKGLNMRIEELTNRWKVEREARVHDNEQAKRRLQQLEEENERLRAR